RRRHQAVRRLMVLVDAQHVEAELVAKLELVQIAVVEEVALLGIVVAVRQRHPRRRIFLVEAQVERRIGHQVKQTEPHEACSAANRLNKATKSSAFSTWGRWPHAGNTSRRDPLMSW